jgi:hypothetical protein
LQVIAMNGVVQRCHWVPFFVLSIEKISDKIAVNIRQVLKSYFRP